MKILILICLFVFFPLSFMLAQKPEDVDFIRTMDFNKSFKQRDVSYGFSDNPSKVSLYNPVYHLLSGSMWIYQKFVSPQLASNCQYEPSCSAYSKQLVRDYGMLKGVFCSADRLMRCNRITLAGLPYSAFDTHDGKIYETTDRYSLK